MLPEVIETKRNHCGLPLVLRRRWPASPGQATPAWMPLCPPKRLFRLVSDVTPGKSHVVQVALGQFGQLAPLKLSLPPDVERLAELLEKPRTMMIYHRFL
jgi:hypothetical protein